jgi:hypothetical protein
MDLNKIFNLFGGDLEESKDKELENFKSSSIFKVKMFIKLIKNGEGFKKNFVNFLSSSSSSLEINEIEGAGDYVMFTRAYFWISQVDVERDGGEFIEFIDIKELKALVFLSLKYFEEIEEYEKCSFLKKFLEKLRNP